jgi:PTH1 family peptidyl-tRNA hydrolase
MSIFDPLIELFERTRPHKPTLIVGLGNPGDEYRDTRHNIGWMLLEYLRGQHQFPVFEKSKEIQGYITDGFIEEQHVVLVQPHTFMNLSGKAVQRLLGRKSDPSHLIVVHDDIDLPIGVVRVSSGRGAGGHRGVTSIVKSLGTPLFTRVRIGIAPVNASGVIAKPRGRDRVARFVLGPFSSEESAALDEGLLKAAQAVRVVLKDGVVAAMNEYNERIHTPDSD